MIQYDSIRFNTKRNDNTSASLSSKERKVNCSSAVLMQRKTCLEKVSRMGFRAYGTRHATQFTHL